MGLKISQKDVEVEKLKKLLQETEEKAKGFERSLEKTKAELAEALAKVRLDKFLL